CKIENCVSLLFVAQEAHNTVNETFLDAWENDAVPKNLPGSSRAITLINQTVVNIERDIDIDLHVACRGLPGIAFSARGACPIHGQQLLIKPLPSVRGVMSD